MAQKFANFKLGLKNFSKKVLRRYYFKSANILTSLKGHVKSNSMNTKIKMIIGMVLIGLAFVFMIGVAYSIDQRNQDSLQEISALQVELANNVAEKAQDYLSKNDLEKISREPIRLADVLAKAEIIYGERELNRKDGVLWIDRKSSSCMITLGAVNGLAPGMYLSVYKEKRQADGTIINERIDDVVVRKSYDIISYVKPAKKALSEFDGDYYRVTVKGSL